MPWKEHCSIISQNTLDNKNPPNTPRLRSLLLERSYYASSLLCAVYINIFACCWLICLVLYWVIDYNRESLVFTLYLEESTSDGATTHTWPDKCRYPHSFAFISIHIFNTIILNNDSESNSCRSRHNKLPLIILCVCVECKILCEHEVAINCLYLGSVLPLFYVLHPISFEIDSLSVVHKVFVAR